MARLRLLLAMTPPLHYCCTPPCSKNTRRPGPLPARGGTNPKVPPPPPRRAGAGLIGLERGLGSIALLRRIGVDRRAVLRADIVALAHPLGRVVALPESLEQRFVAGLLRIEHHQYGLGMAGLPAAHLLIGR